MISAKAAMRTAVTAAAILILGFVGLAMTKDHPPKDPSSAHSEPSRVSVRLLGPASEIKGVAIPAHILAGERPRFFQINEPSVVAVTLPGGKVITIPSKMSFINTEVDVRTKSAVVVDIDLLPLPKSISFREAVAELRRLMRDMGIEPDERMKRHLAEWPEDTPGYDTERRPEFLPHGYRTVVGIGESVAFEVDVRAADDGGWFLALTLAAAGDTRRPLWDINFKAANKPPTKENGEAKKKPGS